MTRKGEISPERTRALVECSSPGRASLYVNGSSGGYAPPITSVEDRKQVLKEVMKVAEGV